MPYNPYLSKQFDAFISHCGTDCKAAVALPLRAQLREQHSLNVFVDETDLPCGGNAPRNMEQALKRCKVSSTVFISTSERPGLPQRMGKP